MIKTARVRGIYRSLTHAEFVMVDKENGGRADALNAGINAGALSADLPDRRRLAARAERA